MKVRLGLFRKFLIEAARLLEGRIEDAKAKYPNLSSDRFNTIVKEQPTGTNNKYLMWTCKQASENVDDLDSIMFAVNLFHRNRTRLNIKDINQYASFQDVIDEVESLGQSKNQQQKNASKDAEIVYRDERFVVIRPHTAEASCKYGANTKWCIAARDDNWFDSYSKDNTKFYFIIDTQSSESWAGKFAVALQNDGHDRVYDAQDQDIGFGGLMHYFKHIINDSKMGPKIWNIISQHAEQFPDTRQTIELRQQIASVEQNIRDGKFVMPSILEQYLVQTPEIDGELVDKLIDLIDKYATHYADLMDQLCSMFMFTTAQWKRLFDIAIKSSKIYDVLRYGKFTDSDYNDIINYLVENRKYVNLRQLILKPKTPIHILQKIAKECPECFTSEHWVKLFWANGMTYENLRYMASTAPEQLYEFTSMILFDAPYIAHGVVDPRKKLTLEMIQLLTLSGNINRIRRARKVFNITPEVDEYLTKLEQQNNS